jgi:serine protease
VVADLTDGTAYVFRVAAINSVGTGNYSPASTPVTPTAPPPPPNDATSVLSAKSQTIPVGKSATLTTLVIDPTTSAPLAATTVTLQAESASQTSFHVVQSLVTSATGTTSILVKPTMTTHYEFQFAGGTGHEASVGNIITISVAPRVAVSASKSRVKRGKTVDLYGTITPVKAGTVVWLQHQVGTTWKTLAGHATVKKQKLPNGKQADGYVLKVPTGSRGSASYRVLVKSSKTMVAGWSTAKKITVT